jgi:transcriptional regulator with GAF, ATPase, and Fis domain
VRVLAATRRDLDREVQDGRFRDDLFHRLAVARFELPPLRPRKGDIAALAAHLCGKMRELRNTVTRQLVLGELARTRQPGTYFRSPR